MTNIIIGWLGGTVPSPWQKLTGYDGRYLQCTTTVGQAGSTGGNSTHTHSIVNFSVGYSGENSDNIAGYGASVLANHNSHALGSNSVASANNAPSYFAFELIYMDMATWEASERRFPSGAVLLSDVVQALSALSRHTESDGKLWKIGTPGDTGGSDTHNHVTSVALAAGGTSGSYYGGLSSGSYSYAPTNTSHTHGSVDVASGYNSSFPARVGTRFYRVTSLTDQAPSNIVCFFDGTPSDKWEIVSWNSCYVQGANSDASTVGSSTHGHASLSGTSASFSQSSAFQIMRDDEYGLVPHAPTTHSHAISFDLGSSDASPLYVKLVPAKLVAALYHINVYTVTQVSDMLLSKSYTNTETATVRIRGEKTQIMSPDVLMVKSNVLGIIGDLQILQRLGAPWDAYATLTKPSNRGFTSSLKLIMTTASWGSSLRLINLRQTTYPVLDAIIKALVGQCDIAQQRCSMMYLSNNIAYATDQEIEQKWGQVYGLARFTGELDESYRRRLKTYTTIQTGSGSKATCEAALDELVGESNAARVETHDPGHVRIYWNTSTAAKRASESTAMMDSVIPTMLAAGIEWEMFIGFVEHSMGIGMRGQTWVDYVSDLLVMNADADVEYYMRPRFVSPHTRNLSQDILTRATLNKSYSENLRAKSSQWRSLPICCTALGQRVSPYDMGFQSQMRNIFKQLMADLQSLKTMTTLVSLDELLLRPRSSQSWMGLSLVGA